jgi:hypothetical protein
MICRRGKVSKIQCRRSPTLFFFIGLCTFGSSFTFLHLSSVSARWAREIENCRRRLQRSIRRLGSISHSSPNLWFTFYRLRHILILTLGSSKNLNLNHSFSPFRLFYDLFRSFALSGSMPQCFGRGVVRDKDLGSRPNQASVGIIGIIWHHWYHLVRQ